MKLNRLEELLKKKGIGPEGSKSLSEGELLELKNLFLSHKISLTTKSTLLAALLILPPTEAERRWLQESLTNLTDFFPKELHALVIPHESEHDFITLIKKIIRLENLNEEECKRGMGYLFDTNIPEYLKGPFLEGERLKRESFLENKSFLEYLYQKSLREQTAFPLLVDIADSYDGANRTQMYSIFVAALLASVGTPTLVHGVESVAPKFGYTSYQMLTEAGKNPLYTINQSLEELHNTSIGWTYLDQSVYFPELYSLRTLRKEMVKRPFLATFEKLLQPVRAKDGNVIFTGYTHPHYKKELVAQLQEQSLCESALIVKGAEGSSTMSTSRDTVCVYYNGKDISEHIASPELVGLEKSELYIDKNIDAATCVADGVKAFKGTENRAYYQILFQALVLSHFRNLPITKKQLVEAIHSGAAYQHWTKAMHS